MPSNLLESAVRSLPRLANALLMVLCIALALRIVNDVRDAVASPTVEDEVVLPSETGPASAPGATWSEREVIVARNLFEARGLEAPDPAEIQAEDLEETKLPLGLVGTLSSESHPEDAWAAIWDAQNQRRLIVQPGDRIGERQVEVLRIERKRLVLSERGDVRELGFDDRAETGPAKPQKRARGRAFREALRKRRGRR
jgi:hypothetical protein